MVEQFVQVTQSLLKSIDVLEQSYDPMCPILCTSGLAHVYFLVEFII
jgi:hypothetical protein